MIREIETKIILNNCYLDNNYKDHILEKLKKTLENNCNKEYGYILEVIDLVKIIDNIIDNTNSFPVFTVTCKIECLKPKIGDIYDGNVCMVFENGIFVDIKNKIKTLIPTIHLKDFEYNSDEKSFKNDNITIDINSEVKIELTSIKYEKKQFICIGKLSQ